MIYFSIIASIVVGNATIKVSDIPPIDLPEFIDQQPIPPTPPPPPQPKPVGKILKNEMYVVQSDGEFTIIASPSNLVTVTKESGPVKIKGQFSGGSGRVETKTFSKKYVNIVESIGNGTVELIIVPIGLKSESEIKRVQLIVECGNTPQPPPTPPTPVDPEVPALIDGDGNKVLIVYEAMQTDSLTKAQYNAVFGKEMRDFLDSKCAVGSDGKTKEWRIFDKDVDMKLSPPQWSKAMKRERKSIPWIIISNGKTGYEGPLPATEAEIMSLLNKYIK
jgi:hypothetical protein